MHGKGLKATMLVSKDKSFKPSVCNMLALDKTQILGMNKKQTKPNYAYEGRGHGGSEVEDM